MTTVGEVMTRKVPMVEPDMTCTTAREIMSAPGVEHLVVLGRSGRIHGVVTRSDIVMAQQSNPGRGARATLGEMLFGRLCPRISSDAPVWLAAQIMFDVHSDAVCVVDSDGVVVGLVTDRDVLSVVAGRRRARAAERVTVR